MSVYLLIGPEPTPCYTPVQTFLYPNDQPLSIPLIHKQMKQAIHFIPLLVGLGIVAGTGTGTAGLTTSIRNYQTLSKDLSDSLHEIAQGLITIQNQLDSLVAVVLQNRRGLYLLTAEKGGLCLFLDESCYFYANQSDIVQGAAKKPYRSSLMNPPEIKQLLAVMVNRLELDALGFTSSRTIHFYHPPTHL